MLDYENKDLQDLKNETWRDIAGYEGYYKVSNKGRVKRLNRTVEFRAGRNHALQTKQVHETIMPQYGWADKGNKGDHRIDKAYLICQLCKDGTQKRFYVHRLVAGAFCDGYDESVGRIYVDHADADGHNNHADNLSWVTISENSRGRRSKDEILRQLSNNVLC